MFKVSEPQLFGVNDKKKIECLKGDDAYKDLLKMREDVIAFKNKLINRDREGNKHIEKGTLGLVSQFGSGKTFFLQSLFCEMYEDQELESLYPIYIDISKYENKSNNLLLLILGEIIKNLQYQTIESSDEVIKKLAYRFKKLLPAAVKLGTNLLFRDNDNFEKVIKPLSDFSESLASYIIEVTDEETVFLETLKKATEDSQIVVMLDNLDRCRPEFVLDIFVLVKRLFSLEQMLFIISYDKQQIINLLKTLYGDGVDIQNYLKKYISGEIYLPQYRFISNFVEYIMNTEYGFSYISPFDNNKEEKENIENLNKYSSSDLYQTVALWEYIYMNTRLSLRKFEQSLKTIIKLNNMDDSNLSSYKNDISVEQKVILLLLIYLKVNFPIQYQELYYTQKWDAFSDIESYIKNNEMQKKEVPQEKVDTFVSKLMHKIDSFEHMSLHMNSIFDMFRVVFDDRLNTADTKDFATLLFVYWEQFELLTKRIEFHGE